MLLDWQVELPRPSFAKQVTHLRLRNSDINDETLAHVAELENLETLLLWGTNISHVGIEHIAVLKKLRVLAMDDDLLTDEMLRTLRENNQLYAIEQATDEVANTRPDSMESVTTLRFWCAPFTDDGLKELVGFTNLTHLSLGRMGISDAAISHLSSFKHLKHLQLHETAITREGIDQLQRALPDCKIEYRE